MTDETLSDLTIYPSGCDICAAEDVLLVYNPDNLEDYFGAFVCIPCLERVAPNVIETMRRYLIRDSAVLAPLIDGVRA